MSDGESERESPQDPLYHLRRAIQNADGEEKRLLEVTHNQIVQFRGVKGAVDDIE